MATLTLEDAQRVIAGAQAKMGEMGVKLTISVVDGRGDLIALARVDGASWRTRTYLRARRSLPPPGDCRARTWLPAGASRLCLVSWHFRAVASSPARARYPSTRTANSLGQQAAAAAPRKRTRTVFARGSRRLDWRVARNPRETCISAGIAMMQAVSPPS